MKSRNNSLDLLRLLSALAVIFMHVNYLVLGDYDGYGGTQGRDSVYPIFLFINIITRFSVPCFIMISGSFILLDKNYDFGFFYKKAFRCVFVPFGIAMVFQLLIDSLLSAINKDYSGIINNIRGVVDGSYNNMWFMYMLAGIYLLTPFIIRIKKSLSEKEYITLSFSLLVWSIISQATSRYKISYTIGIVFSYLGYFMVGDVIKTYSKCLKNRIALIFLAVVSVLLTFVFRYNLNHNISRYVYEAYTAFFSPTIVVFSVSVFAIFTTFTIRHLVEKLAKMTFGVYLFHTFILKYVSKMFSVMDITITGVSRVFFMFVLVTFTSFIVSIIFNALIEGIIKK